MDCGLIVEDLTDARRWLADTLGVAFPGITVHTASTLAEARTVAAAHRHDIALVDLGLPDGTGLDLIGPLKAAGTLTIVTTIFDDDRHLFDALRAGADGYVLKDQSREPMIAMLQGIHSGQPPLSPSIARRVLAEFHARGTAPDDAPSSDALTEREQQTLTLIAKGLTVARCAELMGITANTAAGYVKSVYRKLGISSRAEATLEATRRGLVGRASS